MASHWIGAFVSSFEVFEAISDSCQPQLAGKRGERVGGREEKEGEREGGREGEGGEKRRGREGGRGEKEERKSERCKINNHATIPQLMNSLFSDLS